MAVFFDVAKVDLPKFEKGEFVAMGIERCSDAPDYYICIEITDMTKSQVKHLTRKWRLEFNQEIVAQNENGWRIEVTVSPGVISASGLGRNEIKQRMRDWFLRNSRVAGASIHDWTDHSLTVDLPKNGPWQQRKKLSNREYLQALKQKFDRIFGIKFRRREFYILPQHVDYIVENHDGHWAGSWVEATQYIRSRLAD